MTIRFRSTKAQGAPAAIDLTAHRISGVSAIQAVEALGHGMLVDQVMLRQVADQGNALGQVKARFTHPGMCSDGMGSQLGHVSNFSVQGDKTVGDLQFIDAAAKSPRGDLRTYVETLAKDAPGSFGMSIVFTGTPVWKLPNGSEIAVDDPSLRRGHGEDAYFARPADATTTIPFARCEQLLAVDVVDEPAANRDGLFSAAFSGTSSEIAEQAFAWLDEFRSLHGLGFDALAGFLNRYRASRSLPPTTLSTESPMKLSPRLAALATKPAAAQAIISALSAEKPADEIDILASAYEAHAGALSAQITDLQDKLAKAGTDHAAALKAAQDAGAATAKELAEAKQKIAAFKGFEGNVSSTQDPGSDANAGKSGDQKVDAERCWSTDEKVRAFFHGDKETFTQAVENDGLPAVQAEVAKKA